MAEAEKESLTFLSVDKFEQIPGQGIRGEVEGQLCLAGNRRMMEANRIENSELLAQGEALAEDGKTPLYFALDGKLIGLIAVADVVKPTSAQAIAELSSMGIEVVMLTATTPRPPRPSAVRSAWTASWPRCCRRIRNARSAAYRRAARRSPCRRRHQRCARPCARRRRHCHRRRYGRRHRVGGYCADAQ